MSRPSWFRRHRLKLIIAAGFLGVLFFFRTPILMTAFFWYITPGNAFEAYAHPPAPDYAQDSAWLALPGTKDTADVSPTGLDLDRQAMAGADVFFIHPTTFTSSEAWNQPLDHAESLQRLRDWVLPAQAGAFNSCCRVFAPAYRQATLAAFFDLEGEGGKALDLAYEDIAAAFQNFLAARNEARPFILAGHSQGARHLDQLLREAVTPDQIANDLIAAYLVGRPIPASGPKAPPLPVCTTPAQTGCIVSWNSQTAQAAAEIGQPDSICVNPLTWTDGQAATFEANLGGVDFVRNGAVEPGVADAKCDAGRLLLTDVKSANFSRMPFGEGNYHLYEFNLYYMNIRQNAEDRVSAFLGR